MTHGAPPPVAFIAGATASGKSALAVQVARERGLAVIGADSMQVYRGMEIGTAQPTEADRGGVPHHLIGIADPAEEFHAARFREEAIRAMAAEAAMGRRTIVAGGTGLWMRALREGLFDGPGRDESIRAELRAILDQDGAEALHALLSREDPAAAARLRPADQVRVIRALEVWRLSGRSITEWQDEDQARRRALGPLPPLLVLSRPREELDRRIAARVEMMLAAGWLEEADRLRAMGLPEHASARKALGYRALFEVLKGNRSLNSAREEITLRTRQFARRQETWFRGERDAVWLSPGDLVGAIRGLRLSP